MKTTLSGFIAGILLTLIVWGFLKEEKAATQPAVVVSLKGAQLSYSDLRKLSSADLVPVENDEYEILRTVTDNWVQETMIKKEMQAAHLGQEALFKEKIWSRVHVSYEDLRAYYDQNRELFPQPFEQASAAISQELRRQAYVTAKKEYLDELRKKYDVKMALRQPGSFVEGLAVLRDKRVPQAAVIGEPALKMAPAAAAVPPAPAVPIPSAVPAPSAMPAPAAGGVVFNNLAGRPSLGPDNAKVTLVEFSDFHCPFCGRHAPTLEKLVKDFPNQVRLVWGHYPLAMHQGSERTHQASECAHEQGKFWQFHDAAFAEVGGDKSDAGLKALAAKAGLDIPKFEECLASGRTADIVRRDLTEGTRVGVNGTPATFVNGRLISGAQPYEKFAGIVESLIKTGQFPPEAAPAPAAAPAAAGPVNIDDNAGRPFKGPADAPVTLVQFSDYHCPFCQRVEPTIKQIMDANPGKVKVVWRHNPLPFHTGADKTHTAAECAFQQGKFWEYHDDLFSDMKADRSELALIARAEKLGLDKAQFQSCLSAGQAKAMVDKDLAAGRKYGVSGTPATFVNGALVSGAQPYDSFARLVDSVIKTGKLPADAVKPPAPAVPAGPVQFDDLAGRPFKGPADAPITLVQFSDYHCPFCQRVEPTIKQIMDTNPGKVKVIWRHNPLPFHTGADKTHTAAECAFQQGKFWEYHDDLFSNMQDRGEPGLIARAEKLGLDKAKFQTCLSAGQAKAMVDKDLAAGAKAGVRGTPATFVNGTLVSGAQPIESFNTIIQTELAKKR